MEGSYQRTLGNFRIQNGVHVKPIQRNISKEETHQIEMKTKGKQNWNVNSLFMNQPLLQIHL